MGTRTFAKRGRWLGPGLFLVTLATFCASGATPKHVLILDSFGRDIAPFNIGTSAFRTTLARELGEPVDIYEASLDAARFAEPELEKPFVEFLKSRFESNRLDLVVPIGAPAVRFMAKYREALFAKTPVLFMAAEPRLISPTLLLTNATLVTQRVNPRGMVEDILQMRPDTRNIAVVLGASPLEMFWASQLQGDFLAFTNRVHFIWLNDLSLEQIEQRVASLPPHSFILFGMLVMDASGVPYDGNAPLQRLHTVANAPIFAYFGSQFGSGDIGGRMYQDTEVGMRAARAAIRILHGERPESIAPQILDAASPVYDWRELRRWNIDVTKLPPGSIVQFRQPNFWQLYRGRILVVTGIFVLQLGLIISLAISRARRIRAEKLARESEDRFRTVANSAPVLIWMAGVDKLCTFFNKPWLDFTGRTLEKEFGNGWVEGVHPEDRQQCVEAYEKAFDARQAFTLQYRLRRNDGDYRWISDHGLPRFDTHNSFAGYIGSCIDITELKEVERQQREFKGLLINAHEEERSRLARELHDDITQRLVRLAIDMGTAGLTPTGLKTDGERHTVREELVRLTDDVHALSYQLHPSILDYLGLVEALRTEADRFSRREAIAVDLQLDEIPSSLPPATALGLYRITQEALSNVACHAKATQVHIALKLSTTGITLSIRDNGIGFDAARRLLKPSLGLTGMKERANLVGGSIEIESQAEAGTIIRVQLPVTAITA